MKTKIIYISGSEVFSAADIRAAFDEVRSALGLSADTVLFGVPVDADDAGLGIETTTIHDVVETPAPVIEPIDVVEPIEIIDVAEEKPIKKPRKTTKATTIETTDEVSPTVATEPVMDTDTEKVIPILSILSGKKEEPVVDADPFVDTIVNPDAIIDESPDDNEFADIEPEIVTDTEKHHVDVKIESVSVEKVTLRDTETDEVITTKTVTITDMINDEVPQSPMEKTLEQLLESMTPLREDVIEDNNDIDLMDDDETPSDEIQSDRMSADDEEEDSTDEDVDATLEQLASEFVTHADKIEPTPTAVPAGKIGKLKNILPFKKAKREEPGLMGDLFGWAGIAANDDEFSIPGFFTTTASKK